MRSHRQNEILIHQKNTHHLYICYKIILNMFPSEAAHFDENRKNSQQRIKIIIGYTQIRKKTLTN